MRATPRHPERREEVVALSDSDPRHSALRDALALAFMQVRAWGRPDGRFRATAGILVQSY
jgi:hypothetical protein